VRNCLHERAKTIDSRGPKGQRKRRRYECVDCGYRWTTVEIPISITSKLTTEDQFVMIHLGIDYQQLAHIRALINGETDARP